ncbi:aldo/keto reductase [Rathayibacter sp. VKM Ac-2803]|uniref:aldo/keto reductase n=1 Tax=Rathayibacter sp. VKM Ac-2803 TaxID=2609256 RepID=UPI00135B9A88|nr:aldo/keto reductase [Rathayibacter sp. VKM Ac-2803]MWV47975.1 aldo/keto reductase [Rathayibacter sp. VKM Ac-2803]
MTSATFTLNNGVEIPALGLGVLQSEGDEAASAVENALRSGYRLIDTAAAYFNEREVGLGIRESGVPREDVFLTTKLWMTDYGFDSALRGFDTSAAKLGVDHVDLFLLHWPWAADRDRTIAAYKAAERLLSEGRVRAIGVANFSADDLQALARATDVVPAVNQIEVHPNFQQPELVAVNRGLGILTQAWSPIGGVYGWAGENGAVPPLQNDAIRAIAEAHAKSSAQVILRWQLQEGRSAIPKSVTPARIAENLDVFDFELSADEMQTIRSLDTGVRGAVDPAVVTPEVIDLTIDAA